MAQNSIDIAAPPERVFAVLEDARYYGYWVVGARAIRGWDDDWPAVGSKFHHTQGIPPLTIKDHSIVEVNEKPKTFQLLAKARPAGTFRVRLDLHPNATGTKVVMTETPGDRLTKLVIEPLGHIAIHARNTASLERLKELAEGRGPSPEECASA